MTSTTPTTRNKLKINRHRDAVSSQDYGHTSVSPESSPQFTLRRLVDSESPSSSANKDDPSDTNADEGEGEGRARASSSMDSLGTDLDLSVVISLIAPLVDWLTGSDYLGNLFSRLILDFPWELYNASRRRRPHPSFRPQNLQGDEESVTKIQTKRAATELQRQEFAYLFLSMITPFAGVALLRFVLRPINGIDSISWFSTTLFVLAAGVRPWGHFTSRLREHTSSLHDSIHYPSPDSQFIIDSRLQVVLDRVNSLEQELSTVKRTMATRAYVDDTQDTERTIRKQERRAESTRNSYDARRPPNCRSETIEEDATEQPNTDWRDERSSFEQSDSEAPSTSYQSELDFAGVSRRGHRQSPRNMTNAIANVVTLPYRLAVSILVGVIVAIAPPLRHFFH
ncbi:hypothetical protein EDB92DRAFT_2114243 [Lactarius akahatsu]|uniref:Uncharacterized protein n=1 Tax=Lactarius akahatsu TaxID=416441 RepID=A0AAD4QDW8_9AGAM|nr:hypothetical protein EDB92DRAFT_2114243 [Lactarius akahatsu]